MAPYDGNYETVRRRIGELGLEADHIRQVQRGRLLRDCTDSDIRDAIATSRSLAGVLKKLGVRPGGNQSRLRVRIHDAGLDMSHFAGQGWRAGIRVPVVPRTPLVEVLVKGRPAPSTSDLRKSEGTSLRTLFAHLLERSADPLGAGSRQREAR